MKESMPESLAFQPKHKEGDVKVVEGVKYKWTFSGYTLREYFNHETERPNGDFVPGPGWDNRSILLDDAWAMEHVGRTFSDKEVMLCPHQLPEVPYFQWEVCRDEVNS